MTSRSRHPPREKTSPSEPDSAWEPGRRCVAEESARRRTAEKRVNDRREASVAALKVAAKRGRRCALAARRRPSAAATETRTASYGGRGATSVRAGPNMSEPDPRLVARLELCVANRAEFAGTGE